VYFPFLSKKAGR